jgi:hypothetical protein
MKIQIEKKGIMAYYQSQGIRARHLFVQCLLLRVGSLKKWFYRRITMIHIESKGDERNENRDNPCSNRNN